MGMVCLAPGGGWERVLPSSSCVKKLSKSCSSGHHSFSPNSSKLILHGEFGRRQCYRPSSSSKSRRGIGPSGDPQSEKVLVPSVHGDEDVIERKQLGGKESKSGNDIQSRGAVIGEAFLQGNSAILSACLVGLLTGITVVLFNNAVSACTRDLSNFVSNSPHENKCSLHNKAFPSTFFAWSSLPLLKIRSYRIFPCVLATVREPAL